MINWDDKSAIAVDGFTVAEIEGFVFDSVAYARCEICGAHQLVEHDARDYDCFTCGTPKAITSPLVKLGII